MFDLAQAEAFFTPFQSSLFNLATARNVLFLLPDPLYALKEIRRVLREDGQICVLNPSENLTFAAATALAEQRGLDDLAQRSLINWAQRVEANQHWTVSELARLFTSAGLALVETSLQMGPGLARFGRTIKNNK